MIPAAPSNYLLYQCPLLVRPVPEEEAVAALAPGVVAEEEVGVEVVGVVVAVEAVEVEAAAAEEAAVPALPVRVHPEESPKMVSVPVLS